MTLLVTCVFSYMLQNPFTAAPASLQAVAPAAGEPGMKAHH